MMCRNEQELTFTISCNKIFEGPLMKFSGSMIKTLKMGVGVRDVKWIIKHGLITTGSHGCLKFRLIQKLIRWVCEEKAHARLLSKLYFISGSGNISSYVHYYYKISRYRIRWDFFRLNVGYGESMVLIFKKCV